MNHVECCTCEWSVSSRGISICTVFRIAVRLEHYDVGAISAPQKMPGSKAPTRCVRLVSESCDGFCILNLC